MKALLNLFFPQQCLSCQTILCQNEQVLCTQCVHELPFTRFHLHNENTVKKVFYGRVPLQNATALLYYYKRGLVQHLIQGLKYKGKSQISNFFGKCLAGELAQTHWMNGIEAVIPVPLHKKRFKKRGYNQVEGFGKAIADAFSISYVDDVLIKISATRTQVFKNRLARSLLQPHHFSIQQAAKIRHQHVLLVDDIVTTGATLETCANLLLAIPGVRISIATMAITN